jgi:hypothetical protein
LYGDVLQSCLPVIQVVLKLTMSDPSESENAPLQLKLLLILVSQ